MAKSETLPSVVELDLQIIDGLWAALKLKRWPKSVKENLLGRIRQLEELHGLEPRRYNHG